MTSAKEGKLPSGGGDLAKAKAGETTSSITVGNKGLDIQTLDDAWRLAGFMFRANMLPQSFGKGEQAQTAAVIAIQLGFELGLSPVTAVQNIYVVNNKPSIYGPVALAMCRKNPAFESIHEVEIGTWPKDDYGWRCTVKRRGEEPVVRTFTIEDAKLAGLWQDGKGLTPWHKYKKDMLKYRARSRALADGFSDSLHGLAVVESEEVAYENSKPPARDVTPAPESSSKMDALIDRHKKPEEDVEPESEVAEEESPEPEDPAGMDIDTFAVAVRELCDEAGGPDLYDDAMNVVAKGVKANDLTGEQREQIVQVMEAQLRVKNAGADPKEDAEQTTLA